MTIIAEDVRDCDFPVEDRKTLTVNRRRPSTREELDFAGREKTELLETRYVLLDKPRDESFATPEGHTFRSAGALYIRTCRDGARRFVAYMHKGSVHHDFRYFDRVINDARFGRMDGWDRYTFNSGDEGWIFDYPNYQIDHLQDFRPAQVIMDESSDSPNILGFGTTWGYPCEEPRCREGYHDDEDCSHTLESVHNQLTERGGYEIEICKDMTKPDSDWYVNFWANGDLTELRPEHVATLANDLQWMGIECKNTNDNKARTLRRAPGVTDELKERDQ